MHIVQEQGPGRRNANPNKLVRFSFILNIERNYMFSIVLCGMLLWGCQVFIQFSYRCSTPIQNKLKMTSVYN